MAVYTRLPRGRESDGIGVIRGSGSRSVGILCKSAKLAN
jgi:hypothetical protein